MAEKSDLAEILVHGVDLKARRIYFGVALDWMEAEPGDFNQASVEFAVRALHKMAQDAPGKPIEIHMNSYGGDPYAMLSLYDEILSCPCQVKFYGSGAIMSAATWIMVVCDERYLYPHTTVMIHDGSEDFSGTHTDNQIRAGEEKRLQDLLYDIYTANSRMPKEFWQDICQRDVYLSASEAVSFGLADKIVEPKKRGNLRKMRQAAMKKVPSGSEMQKIIIKVYSRINRMKVPKVQLNEITKEPADPHLVVDDKPVESEKPQQPVEVAEASSSVPSVPRIKSET
jgi:ATP-dependent protease ClpP protease subunit